MVSIPETTPQVYMNLDEFLAQFCEVLVPLLAEFSCYMLSLHPEKLSFHSKVLKNPLYFGHVCRHSIILSLC
jgi:hypothetical protein